MSPGARVKAWLLACSRRFMKMKSVNAPVESSGHRARISRLSERVHTTALSQSVRSWLNSRWSLLLAGVACGLIPLLLDGGGRDSVRLWLANALPWLLLWLCALGLTRRPLFAASLTWLLAAVVYQVNQIKLRELGLPLVPSDVLVFDQMLSSPALYWRYLRLPSLPQLLLLLLLIESCRRSWRLRPLCRPLRFAQALLFVLAGGVLLSVQQRWAPWPQIYDQEDLRISFWHAAAGAEQAGMAAHFMLLQPFDPATCAAGHRGRVCRALRPPPTNADAE